MPKPKKRKSSIYTDKKGFSYYQTMSYDGTFGHTKGRVNKYLGKNLTKAEIKEKQSELDKHYNMVDTNTIVGNPIIKKPKNIDRVFDEYNKYNRQRVDDDELSYITYQNHKGYTEQFRKYIVKKRKNIRIHQITTDDIKKYVKFRRRQKLSDNTIRNDLTYLKTFFKWLMRENHIVENPYNHEIKMPKYVPRTIDQIPIGKEWDILYKFISKSLDFKPTTNEDKKKWTWFNRNKDFREMLFVMLNTAMRGGEVRIMKWKPNDLEYGTPRFPYCHLNRNRKSATIYFKRTLTTNFEFNQKTIDLIEKRYDSRNPKDEYVFTNPQTNSHYNDSQFNDNFNRLCEGLGLVDKDTQKSLFTPHAIRHGVISQLLSSGQRIEDISKVVARHSKIGTTYDIYGHFQKGKGKSILDTLSDE